MLRFFRKMRKALVPENRFGRYFFYAVGEIVLVVVGILIALQVNDWNEDRKNHLKATQYKMKLVSDLIMDTIQINDRIAKNRIVIQDIEDYFNYFEESDASIEQYIDSVENIELIYLRYFPINYTFSDMQSTGNSAFLTEKQRKSLLELSNQQDFIGIILDRVVTDIKLERHEAYKFLDFQSKPNLFEKLSVHQEKSTKIQGLLHLHNFLTSYLELFRSYEHRGRIIIQHSKEAIELLQQID